MWEKIIPLRGGPCFEFGFQFLEFAFVFGVVGEVLEFVWVVVEELWGEVVSVTLCLRARQYPGLLKPAVRLSHS